MKRVRHILLWTLTGLATILVVLSLLLQMEFFRTAVVNAVLARINPYEAATLRVESTSGSVFRSLGIRNLVLERADGSLPLTLSSGSVRYRLLPTLRGRIRLDELLLDTLNAALQRDSLGSLDLVAPWLSSDTAKADFHLGAFRLRQGSVSVTDSSGRWQVDSLHVDLNDLETLPGFAVRLDTLGGSLVDPVTGLRGRVALAGRLGGEVIALDTLLYRTSRSAVSGGGLLMTGQPTPGGNSAFRLDAHPLALDDIRPLFPDLRAGLLLELDSNIALSGRAIRGHLTASLGKARMELQTAGALFGDSLALAPAERVTGSLIFSGVDPPAILNSAPETGPLSGSVRWDLGGSTWTSLSGTSSVQVDAVTLPGLSVRRVTSDQEWTDGLIRLKGQGRVNQGQVTVSGEINPSDAGLPVDVTAVVTDWSIDQLSQGAATGVLSATIRARGSFGDENRGAGWGIRASFYGTRVGDCIIQGPVNARNVSGRVVLDSALEACGGRITGEGSYLMASGAWTLANLGLEDVSLTQLVSDTTRSILSGRIQGRGSPGRSLAEIHLNDVRYGAYRADSLDAVAQLRASTWTLGGLAHSGPGSVAFDLAGDASEIRIERLVADALDLAYTAGLNAFPSSLSASIQGNRSATSTDIQLRLDPSTINTQRFDGGTARVQILGDSLRSGGSLDLEGNGSIAFSGHGNLATGAMALDTLGFASLDLGALLPRLVPTRLTGHVEGTLTRTIQDGRLVLEPVGSINGIPVQGGNSLFSVDSTSAWTRTRVLAGGGEMLLMASLDRQSERYQGSLESSSFDLIRVAGLDSIASSVTTRLQFQGRGFERASASFAVGIDSLRLTYGDVRVDSAAGRITWSPGVLHLDEVEIHGTPVEGTLSGGIPLNEHAPDERYALTGVLALQNLDPIFRVVGLQFGSTSGTISVRGSGRPGQFQLSAETRVEGVDLGELHIASVNVLGSLELAHGLRPRAAEVRLAGSILSLPGVAAQSVNSLVTLTADSLLFEADVEIGPQRNIRVTGSANRAFDHVVVETLDMQLDEAAWSLVTPTDMYLTDGLEVSGLVAVADSQRIALGGFAGSSRGSNLYLSATSVRMNSIADILGYSGFGATVNVALSMNSPSPAQTPNTSGTVSARLTSRGRAVGTVQGRMAYRDDRLNLDASMRHVSGKEASVTGFVPLSFVGHDLGRQPVSLRAEADDFPIAWIRPFLDPTLIDQIDGRIQADLLVRGTYDEPLLSGEASILRGRLGLPDLGKPRKSMVYQDAQVHLTFQDQTVLVDSAQVRSGRGVATASGTVALTDLTIGEIDLRILARDFLAIDSAPYRAVVGANMNLSGTTRRPRLGGRVRVEQGDFYLTEETSAAAFEPVNLTREDLLTLEERFGLRVTEADTTTFDFYEALTIQNLQVELARNSWLRSPRNPAMDIQFEGSLDVSKRPRSELEVYGAIDVIPDRSRIDQFGRRFEIDQGNLTFSGPVEQPDLNLGATYQVKSRTANAEEVTISLQATGRPDDLTVTFSSDPAMELSDIVSYIATGRPASESLQFGGTSSEGYLRSAAGLAVGPITTLVENLAGAGLGLDVVDIQQDNSNVLRLTAGKYVSPRFFVSVSQPLSFSNSATTTGSDATEVAMEYEVVRSILVSLLSRGSILRVNLRWERAY